MGSLRGQFGHPRVASGHFGTVLGSFAVKTRSKFVRNSITSRFKREMLISAKDIRYMLGAFLAHTSRFGSFLGDFGATLPHFGVISLPSGGRKSGFVWSKALEAVLQNYAPV